MRILAIGAHQDDNEFRFGGLAKKYVKAGYRVKFLSMCNGCGGHHLMTADEISARRRRESAAVAEHLGVEYDVWDIDDCTLVADLPTRERLIRYIREFNPDLILTHRTNDYHADHRAAAQLVQDASYILTVPHTCPDVPAMRYMPVIVFYEDYFKNPPFTPTYVVDITDTVEDKLYAAHLNTSQVYEWLPYNEGEDVPPAEERYEWLKGMDVNEDTSDEELLEKGKRGYLVRYAKPAARFRDKLVEKYGPERGKKIRFAEAYELSEYGKQPDRELEEKLFNL